MIKRSIFGLLLIGLLLAVGCGQKGRGLRVEFVEGIVTLDGQPLGHASVTFIPANEGGKEEVALGFTDANGMYRLSSMNGDPDRGAVAGEYIITVSKIEVYDPKAGMSPEEAAVSRLEVTQTQVLPRIYQDRENTPLSAAVNRGRNRINIELSSER